jgi:hypothetical protein
VIVDHIGAVFDLVVKASNACGLPLAPAKVFRSWQNRVSQPLADEYATITGLTLARRGSNVRGSGPGPDEATVMTLWEAQVQVDWWGSWCLERALAFEALASSPDGCGIMAPLGVQPLECPGGVKDMAEIGGADQHVKRASVTLRLSFWSGLGVPEEGTEGPLRLGRIENVDQHHPPHRS